MQKSSAGVVGEALIKIFVSLFSHSEMKGFSARPTVWLLITFSTTGAIQIVIYAMPNMGLG